MQNHNGQKWFASSPFCIFAWEMECTLAREMFTPGTFIIGMGGKISYLHEMPILFIISADLYCASIKKE